MAKQKAKGSLIYEILIVILIIVLVATLLYPKSIWEEIDKEATLCHDQLSRIFDSELLFMNFSENFNFDSSLVNVIEYIKNDSIWGLDSLRTTLRDSLHVKLLVDNFRNYQEITTIIAVDSAVNMVANKTDSLVSARVDSIVGFMLDNLLTCPTHGIAYNIEIVDTSAIKVFKVNCPLDSTTLDSLNSDFWFNVIGGGLVENHGIVDNGEVSWVKQKRK